MKELLPQRKVTYGVLANALCLLTLKVLKRYGIEFTADEVVQLMIVILFAVQWLVPNKAPSAPEVPSA